MIKELIIAVLIGIIALFSNTTVNTINHKIESLEEQTNLTEEMSLGAIHFVSGKVYRLAGSGITAAASSIELQSFQKPNTDEELAMTDFGEIGYAAIGPGTSKKEFISFTGVTQSGSSDEATLTGVTRGLQFTTPYTASTTLRQTHSGSAKLIISNLPQLYNEMAVKKNDETVTGDWIFSGSVTLDADDIAIYDDDPSFTSDAQIITKKYADDLSYSGTADANYTTKGIIELATTSEIIAGTATGSTGVYLVTPTDFFNVTTSAANLVPVTDTDGKLSQGFIDLTEDYEFSGTVTSTGETILNATTTIGGYFTVNGSSTLATSTFSKIATFSVIPALPASDPTTDNQAARKSYVDDSVKDSLGTRISKTFNVTYQATSSAGFACVYSICDSATEYINIFGYTNSTSTLTTIVVSSHAGIGAQYSAHTGGWCMPVEKDFYWQASTTENGSCSETLTWVPLE